MTSPNQTLTRSLVNPKFPNSKATITITVEELAESQWVLKCTASAVVPKLGFFRIGDPETFFEIFRVKEDGQHVAVYRSEPKKATVPVWNPIKMRLQVLCNGDKDRAMVWKISQHKRSGSKLIC